MESASTIKYWIGSRMFALMLQVAGMLATVGCLVGMCRATLQRNMMRAQLYMRGRVAAQFFTVCVLVGGALAYGNFDPSKFISHKKDAQSEANSTTHSEPI